jgi:hypothetical protein
MSASRSFSPTPSWEGPRAPAIQATPPSSCSLHPARRAFVAWMLEVGGSDPHWPNLHAQGVQHYANAMTSNDCPADPHRDDLARTARAVAETSVRVPTVVVIDDAGWLDEDLAVTLTENLAARHDGHVLVVAAVSPASACCRRWSPGRGRGSPRAWSMSRTRTRTWGMSPAQTWSGSCARTCPKPQCGGLRVPRRRSRRYSRSCPRSASPRSPSVQMRTKRGCSREQAAARSRERGAPPPDQPGPRPAGRGSGREVNGRCY